MTSKNIAKKIFQRLSHLQHGHLTLTTPDGKQHQFEGKQTGYTADIEILDWGVFKNIAFKGDIGFAEDYRDGNWQTTNIKHLVCLILQNRSVFDDYTKGMPFVSWLINTGYLFRQNSLKGSKQNIHSHYDLGNEFYSLWLDPSMTYSSAVFAKNNEPLKQAQDNKYDRIIERLNSSTGDLLEIGCGWGGFAERCIDNTDRDIKCITLSEEQHRYAQKRLTDKASVQLEDYRHQSGKYDNIVSIEMFEAVGEKYWNIYFSKLKSLLKNKGNAVIQTITINDEDFPRYRRSGDFIRSYIFPGGMLPSPSVFKHQAKQAGLKVSDEFYFGKDYARTLDIWLLSFEGKIKELKQIGLDDAFIRLWRFYLAACSAGFETQRTNVMQVQLDHA